MGEFVMKHIEKDIVLVSYRGPKNAERIEVPPGVTRIGEMAFWGMTNLLSVKLPLSVTEICDSAFGDCTNLEYINLPPNLERIGEFAFAKCSSLRSIDLPRSIKELGSCAFYYAGLKSIDIPGKIARIKFGTFSFCGDLETVWIRPGVREMEAAFFCCFSLTTVHIPDSLEKITRNTTESGLKVHAFESCGCLENIEASDGWKEDHPYLLANIVRVVDQAVEVSVASRSNVVTAKVERSVPQHGVTVEKQNTPQQKLVEENEPSVISETKLAPEVAKVVYEAVNVINDMLEVGLAASIFSDLDYEGFIIAVADARPPFGRKHTDYGLFIKMCSVSDLATCLHKYPRMRKNPQNWEMIYGLKRFAEKYSDCYDPAEEAYIYCTKNTVAIPKKTWRNRETVDLRGILFDEVRKQCPLADFEGTPIHTKNVYH